MYKTRLQELCQRRMWALPEYTASRDGPDHNPRFHATVFVNGASFDSPEASKSSKEAHNKAAMVAFDHLAASAGEVPPSPSAPRAPESQISFKNQLQIYAQKKNIELPIYNIISGVSLHAHCFKATVKVDGKDFESPEYFKTIKEAEHAAARVALMCLPHEESQPKKLPDESMMYKNFLQELMQKEGLSLPTYTTVSDSASHTPSFSSTVEVEGEHFKGDVAKTKKQAEINAAKIAWCHLKERRQSRLSYAPSLNSYVQKQPEPSCQPTVPIFSMISEKESALTPPLADGQKISVLDIMRSSGNFENDRSAPPHKPGADYTMKDGELVEHTMSRDMRSSSSTLADCSNRTVANIVSGYPKGGGKSSLPCNRVHVYPRKPNLVLPEGATELPFSDDLWVAVSLDFANNEGVNS
ncbi:double-stranded RNA-binding protein 1-like [Typha angustifolia]|uniref:double-stranded RNA-binding protein 1-like n=1 Tax=Typha angustifolia TaxID=59011 RepID=UPI003C2B55AE